MPISVEGLTTPFGISNWNTATGKWGAQITNGLGTLSGSSYLGSVTFWGTAAGTIGADTFSGTAAGIVK